MTMKKAASLLVCCLLLLGCFACGASPSQTQGTSVTPEPGETPDNATPSNSPADTPEPDSTPEPEQTPAPTMKPTKVETRKVVFSEDFESGTTDFHARGGETVAVTEEHVYEGKFALAATGRSQTWNGPELDLSDVMKAGGIYEINAFVKYEGDLPSAAIYAKYVKNGDSYQSFAQVNATKGEWIEIKSMVALADDTETCAPYFETDYSNADSAVLDIYVDNVVITQITVEVDRGGLPVLKDAYKDYFSIGVAVGANELAYAERAEVITTHFNSMTMGNEMKPDNILDVQKCNSDPTAYYTEPALKFNVLDVGMQFAQKHGIPMRGHTLLWHSQTPKPFFTEDYSYGGALVSREVMIQRLESYIKQVLEYCQTTYPGVVYAWDVVNEAIHPTDKTTGNIRKTDSLWYEVVGEDYVELAFTYARKYADPDVKLFYNDFNEYERVKSTAIASLCKDLYDKGLLDGIGLQSHISMGTPNMMDYIDILEKYGAIGCELQLTELDISQDKDDEEAQINLASRYKRLMTTVRNAKDAGINITNVTLWGLTDDMSWLKKDGPRFPLLFDPYLAPKPAFWGFLCDDSIPLT